MCTLLQQASHSETQVLKTGILRQNKNTEKQLWVAYQEAKPCNGPHPILVTLKK